MDVQQENLTVRESEPLIECGRIDTMAQSHVSQPITLRCGLTLPNRLVKASMSEGIATAKSLPEDKIRNVYQHWAKGGWGMIITGMHLLEKLCSARSREEIALLTTVHYRKCPG